MQYQNLLQVFLKSNREVRLRQCSNHTLHQGEYKRHGELTQEAFVRAMQSIKKFKGQSGFYTWLFRIGINLALNHRQRKQKIHFHSLQPESGETGHQADGLAAMMVTSFESELYRFPLAISTRSYAVSALVMLLAAAASGLLVRRRLDHLDLVEVLKGRE